MTVSTTLLLPLPAMPAAHPAHPRRQVIAIEEVLLWRANLTDQGQYLAFDPEVEAEVAGAVPLIDHLDPDLRVALAVDPDRGVERASELGVPHRPAGNSMGPLPS